MAFHRYFVLEEEKEMYIENAHPRSSVEHFNSRGRGGGQFGGMWDFCLFLGK